MHYLNGFKGPALRVWGLATLLALAVFFVTRIVLLGHSSMYSEQAVSGLLGGLMRGVLRDIPVAALVALPWLFFEWLLIVKWRLRLSIPLFAIFTFTLLFVGVSEVVFWDEFSVRFNFIAVDYLVFTTEVIGNIRESYPVGPIIGALLVVSLLIVWCLRRPVSQAASLGFSRRVQLPWLLAVVLVVGLLAARSAAPDFSTNAYANELADNGWRSFLAAARQNRLDYRQFYATRPDAEVMKDLQRLSGKGVVTATHLPARKAAAQLNRQPKV